MTDSSIPPLRVGVTEACRALSISRAHLYALIGRGEIRPHKDGTRTLFSIAELDDYVRRHDPAARAAVAAATHGWRVWRDDRGVHVTGIGDAATHVLEFPSWEDAAAYLGSRSAG